MTTVDYTRKQLSLDALALGAVVLPVVAIYYLVPPEVQAAFVFHHDAPETLAMLTSTYLHHETPGDLHLWGNVATYLLVVLPTWALHVATGRRLRFWAVLAVALLAFPFLITAGSYVWFTSVVELPHATSRGFSGVVAGIAGYLLMSVLYFALNLESERLAGTLTGVIVSLVLVCLLAINVEYVAPVVWPVLESTPRAALAATGVSTIYVGARSDVLAPRPVVEWAQDNPVEMGAVATGTVGFLVVFLVAFPADLGARGTTVNVVSHGLGLFLGVLASAVLRWGSPGVDANDVPSHEPARSFSD